MGFWFQRPFSDTYLTDLTNMFFVVRDCLLFYRLMSSVWELFSLSILINFIVIVSWRLSGVSFRMTL